MANSMRIHRRGNVAVVECRGWEDIPAVEMYTNEYIDKKYSQFKRVENKKKREMKLNVLFLINQIMELQECKNTLLYESRVMILENEINKLIDIGEFDFIHSIYEKWDIENIIEEVM